MSVLPLEMWVEGGGEFVRHGERLLLLLLLLLRLRLKAESRGRKVEQLTVEAGCRLPG